MILAIVYYCYRTDVSSSHDTCLVANNYRNNVNFRASVSLSRDDFRQSVSFTSRLPGFKSIRGGGIGQIYKSRGPINSIHQIFFFRRDFKRCKHVNISCPIFNPNNSFTSYSRKTKFCASTTVRVALSEI